jgi:hypothetical protein
MMPLDDEKLKQELIRNYQNRPEIPITDAWQQDVMREIRRIGREVGGVSFSAEFGASVRRLVPVAGLLLLLMITGAVLLGPSADTLIADLFLSDPVDFVFSDIFRG